MFWLRSDISAVLDFSANQKHCLLLNRSSHTLACFFYKITIDGPADPCTVHNIGHGVLPVLASRAEARGLV